MQQTFATKVADVDGMLIALGALVDSGKEVALRSEFKGGSYIKHL